MKHLCDSNVFIALTLEAHPHHKRAVEWLESSGGPSVLYFCRATLLSYLRLLTVRELMHEHVCTNDQAIRAYRTLRSDARVDLYQEEPTGLELHWLRYAAGSQSSPKRWMDAYLAGFARAANLSLVTFDRAFKSFPDLDVLVLTDHDP